MQADFDINVIRKAVSGTAAAFRCVTELEPAGGPNDKVFPSTYEGGKYATEERRFNGEIVPCVLLDSVQSQANRMEIALQDAWEKGLIQLPILTLDFTQENLEKPFRITSLEAPHRIADALLRDSLFEGVIFRKSYYGKILDQVSVRNCTPLFEICPTALVFGMWDSTGPKGGLGAKFARSIVSEIIGINATIGVKTSSRLDPAQIMLQAGPLFVASTRDVEKTGAWTLDEKMAERDRKGAIKLGKDGKPSEANHGNVKPTISPVGGFTIDKAIQTTVISLSSIRRLRFPLKEGDKSNNDVDHSAQTTLASLALCAAVLNQAQGYDLRSRCQLHPTKPFVWEILDTPGEEPKQFSISPSNAIALLNKSIEESKKIGLRWLDKEIILKPVPQLVELVRKSQELAVIKKDDSGGSP